MTASLLVAASITALLGAPQGLQGALDVAYDSRSDSTRTRAPGIVAKSAAVVSSNAVAVTAGLATAPFAAPAVPLPDPPRWSTPTPTIPIPAAADWAIDLPGDFLVDSIVVEKGERRMTVFYRGVPVRRYRVALGRNPVGDKMAIGDYRTPEGMFYISGRNPFSKFYKSLAISYPDSAHIERAAELGVSPGGNIMIHGLPPHQAQLGSAHVLADWTEGCIAVTNEEIDELWRAVEAWSAIEIKP